MILSDNDREYELKTIRGFLPQKGNVYVCMQK